MAGKDRRRQVARERYERRQAQRAAARARARQRLTIASAAGTIIVIVGIVLAVIFAGGGKSPSAASPGALSAGSSSPTTSAPPPPPPTYAAGCTTSPSATPTGKPSPWSIPSGADQALKTEPTITIPAGPVPTKVQTKDLIVGTGQTAKATDTVKVNYLGVNYVDCKEFDSSWSRGAPSTFSLTGVVPGFQQGVAGMKVGGRREIIIPPDQGYGTQSTGPIQANEELVFVVDLLGVTTGNASGSASGSATAPPASPSSS